MKMKVNDRVFLFLNKDEPYQAEVPPWKLDAWLAIWKLSELSSAA